jgi:hypothetical protein
MSKASKKPARSRQHKAIRSKKVGQPRPHRKPTATSADKQPTKIATILALLSRPQGATIGELVSATGWLKHSIRGALAGTIRKKLGLKITREKTDSVSRYRTVTNGDAKRSEDGSHG